MTGKIKKFSLCVILCIMLFTIFSCGDSINNEFSKVSSQDEDYYVYYVNEEYTGLETRDIKLDTNQDAEKRVKILLREFSDFPEGVKGCSAKPVSFKILNYNLKDGVLKIDIDKGYLKTDSLTQLFFKAGIVLTLSQLEEVSYISMTVGGQPMVDSSGNLSGYMNEESFVCDEVFKDRKVTTFTVYYADEEGKSLKPVRKEYEYTGKISKEEYVIELLREDERQYGGYATLPDEIEISNVYVNNGICYINFTSDIKEESFWGTDSEVMLYSIVNTLTELPGVSKVQFLIKGSCEGMFGDISIEKTFTSNLDIVKN